MKTTGNTILITGGGSGLGREFARRFHDLGNTVIVAGRRMAALEETIAGREHMHAMQLDIVDPGAVQSFAERVRREHPGLNSRHRRAAARMSRTRGLQKNGDSNGSYTV